MKKRAGRTNLRANHIAITVAAAFAPWLLHAQTPPAPNTLPTGGVITHGSGTIHAPADNPTLSTMQIDQTSARMAAQFGSFSIGERAHVNVTQPNSSSIALFKDVGGSVSQIYGRLTANGQLFVSNPNGVLIGRTGRVEAAGFIASTLTLDENEFMLGGNSFNWVNIGAIGRVINEGTIITPWGYTMLAGPLVHNDGVIVANRGTVVLAAGDRVSLDLVGDGLISVSVDQAALNASAINTGTIEAEGGKVVLTARSANALLDTVVNAGGVIRASSLIERNGEIVLDGGTSGTTQIAGTVDARNVTVEGATISQATSAAVIADTLTTESTGNTTLTGTNQIAQFTGSSGAGSLTLVDGGTLEVQGATTSNGLITLTTDSLTNAGLISNGGGASTANVVLSADAFDLTGGTVEGGAAAVIVRPRTGTRSLGIEAAGDTTLSNADIASINTSNFVVFGSGTGTIFTGNMTIGANAQVNGGNKNLAFFRSSAPGGTTTIGPGGVSTTGNAIISAGGGAIVSNGGTVSGDQVQLRASQGIGSAAARVQTRANALAINNTGSQGAFVSEADNVTLRNVNLVVGGNVNNVGNFVGGGGAYDVAANGALTVGGPINTLNGAITLNAGSLTNNSLISNGGGANSANMILNADAFNLANGTVQAGAGAVILRPRTGTNSFGIEAAGDTTLTNADIGSISTSNFVVLGSGTGTIFTGNMTIGQNVQVDGGTKNLAFFRSSAPGGTTTIGSQGVTTTGDAIVSAGGGAIVSNGGTVSADEVQLRASQGIGSATARVQTNANALAINNTGNQGAFVSEVDNVTLRNVNMVVGGNVNNVANFVGAGGAYDVAANGALTVGGPISTQNGAITLNAGSLTNNSLITNGGGANNANMILSANAFDLADGNIEGGAAAVILRPRTGTNSFGIEAAGDTTLTNADIDSINTSNFVVFGSGTGTIFTGNMTIGANAQVNGGGKNLAFFRSSAPGGITTIGSQGATTSGDLIVSAGGGAIVSNGGTVSADEVQLRASQGIGSATARVQTNANALAINNTGSQGAFVSEAENVTLRNVNLVVGGNLNNVANFVGAGGAYDVGANGALTVGGPISTVNGAITLNAGSLINNSLITNGGGASAANLLLSANAFDLAHGNIEGGAAAVILRPRTGTNSFGIEAAGDTTLTNADIASINTSNFVVFGSGMGTTFTGNMTIGANTQVNGGGKNLAFFRSSAPGGTTTIGSQGVTTTGDAIISAGGGAIVSNGGTVSADEVQLRASQGIGSATARVQTNANALAINNTGSQGAFVSEANNVTLRNVNLVVGGNLNNVANFVGAGGVYDVAANGALTVGGPIHTLNGAITLNAGSLTNESLITNGGGSNTASIIFNADAFNLADGTIEGGAGAVALRPRTGTNSFGIESASATTISNADIASIHTDNFIIFGSSTGTTFTGNMTIGENARVDGNGKNLAFSRSLTPGAEMITIGSQGVTTTGDIIIGAGGGGIRSNGGTITGDEVVLRATNGIGTPTARVKTAANALALNNAGGGGVFVSELDNVTLRTISLNAGGPFTVSNSNSGSFSLISGGDVNVAGLVSSAGSMILDAGGNLKLDGSVVDAVLMSNGGQTITARSIDLTAQNGRRANIENTNGDQSVIATGGGMNLQVPGGFGVAQIINTATDGNQTVGMTGQLNVLGGVISPTTSRNSGIFKNGAGGMQTVSASGITLQGASSGTSAGALIASQGDQSINVAGGDINLIGGSGGTGNNAQIAAGLTRQQTIVARNIDLRNGFGGTDTVAGIFGGRQTIDATGNVTLTSQGALVGTAPGGPGVRIGAGAASTAGTDLTLRVGGNLVLNGGSAADNGSGIGSSGAAAEPAPNKISIDAGGSVILNGGTLPGTGARIGSSAQNGAAGGDLSIKAGGSIELNGTVPGAGTAIRTLGDVALQAASISEASNGFIVANALTTTTSGNTRLTGPNQIASFNATSTRGDVSLRNTGVLDVTGMSATGDATISNIGNVTVSGPWTAGGTSTISVGSDIVLNARMESRDVVLNANDGAILQAETASLAAQTLTTSSTGDTLLEGVNEVASFKASSAEGDISVRTSSPLLTLASMELPGELLIRHTGAISLRGNVSALAHDINATGDVTIGSADAQSATLLHAPGAVSISTPGSIIVRGGSAPGASAQITGHGPMNISAGGNVSLTGGSGNGAFARILGYSDINLTVGGFITLGAGTGVDSWARVQTASRDSVITLNFPNLASGGYVVNGIEGLLRDGHTGFLSGNGVAAPGHQLITIYGAP